jgi:LemA protein
MEPTQEKGFLQRNMKWLVVLGVLVLLAFWAIGVKNSFVTGGEAITSQWAQVENQYQRRFDLIPNIVNTVKGVAKQETTVFTAIADARTKYSGATTPDERAQAASQVESALGRLLVIAEAYPTLQSSQAYRDLIVSLEGTENRLATERMKYNELVKGYNTKVKVFPSSLVAKMFGVEEKAYFEVSDEAKVNPTVDFNN